MSRNVEQDLILSRIQKNINYAIKLLDQDRTNEAREYLVGTVGGIKQLRTEKLKLQHQVDKALDEIEARRQAY